ncbi:MAG TPA: FGGY family carbohydrate kinase [Candidatus Polarisedimenticolaceae bacterium]
MAARGREVASRLFVVLDQGGRSSRALVFDEAGTVVASARRSVRETRAGPRVELPAEALVRSLETCLEKVRRELGGNAARVASAALATQRATIVAWDRTTGRALTPAISWQDRRAAAWLRRLEPRAREIATITGLRLSPHYGANKLRWCLARLPEVRRARREGRLAIGPLSSFLTFRLTREGACVADPANAGRTLLVDARRGDWSPALLDAFGIPRDVLPEIVPTRAAHGTIAWGTRALPLQVVSGDQSCALFAFGEPDPEVAVVNFGTGAFVQRPVGWMPRDRRGLLSSVVFADRARTVRVLEGTVNGGAAAIDLVADRLGMRDPRRALDALPDADGPLVLNAVSGLAAPFWRPDATSVFVGRGTPVEKLRAVAESIVFLVAVNLERIDALAGRTRSIVATGGLSRVDALCRGLADLTGRVVTRPAEVEATAQGAAFLLGARAPDRVGDDFDPRDGAALRRRFRRWRRELDRRLGA